MPRPVDADQDLAVDLPLDGAEHDLEDAVGGEGGLVGLVRSVKGGSVDHVPDALAAAQLVVELLQGQGRVRVAADLEELDADLVGGGPHLVEDAGGLGDDLARLVRRLAVGDDDNVDWGDAVDVAVVEVDLGLVVAQVGAQDVVEPHARGRRHARPHELEHVLDDLGVLDVAVPGAGHAARLVPRVLCPVVQEVHVDAVVVVLHADGQDGRDGLLRLLPPPLRLHRQGVVYQEDGVELFEERILVVSCVGWRMFNKCHAFYKIP